MEYRDFIDNKANEIITGLGGTITPAPVNPELYRDFLDRKFDDVINAIGNLPNIKSFTYTGDGTTSFVIQFPELPKVVLAIYGTPDSTRDSLISNYVWGLPRCACFSLYTNQVINSAYRSVMCNVNNTSYRLRLTTTDSPIDICNKLNTTYTVYYI